MQSFATDVAGAAVRAPLNVASHAVSAFADRIFREDGDKGSLKFPPIVPWGNLAAYCVKHGPFARHKAVEAVMMQSFGQREKIFCLLCPGANTDFNAKGFGVKQTDGEPLSMVGDVDGKKKGEGTFRMLVWVGDQQLAEQVMTDRETYPSRGRWGLSEAVPQGLLALPTGAKHSYHRSLVNSLFTTRHLKHYSQTVTSEVEYMLEKWNKAADQQKAVDSYLDLIACTEDILGKILIGKSFEQQKSPEHQRLLTDIRAYVTKKAVWGTVMSSRMVDLFVPAPTVTSESGKKHFLSRKKLSRGMGKAVKQMRLDAAAVEKMRVENDEGREEYPSIVAAMLKNRYMEKKKTEERKGDADAQDEDKSKFLTEKDIADEIMTLRAAGHETTSNTLSWTMMCLAQNPDALKKCQAEADAVLGKDLVARYEHVDKLRYCKQTFMETMRMYPTVPSYPRCAIKKTKLGGFDIPKGSLIFIAQPLMNRDPKLWGDDQHSFRPERFDKHHLALIQSRPVGCPYAVDKKANGSHQKRMECPGPAFGFLPFGAGNRTCVGQRLAMMESTMIIASIVRNFDFELAEPNKKIIGVSDITYGPKNGLKLKLKRRSNMMTSARL